MKREKKEARKWEEGNLKTGWPDLKSSKRLNQ